LAFVLTKQAVLAFVLVIWSKKTILLDETSTKTEQTAI